MQEILDAGKYEASLYMDNELTTRRLFAAFQVIFGLAMPVVFTVSLFTKAMVVAAGLSQLAYWLGIPAICFAVLAWASLLHSGHQFRISRFGMWGAAVAGYLAFALPVMLLWLTTGAHYRGGGANIGVALLILALPTYLPVVMLVGLGCGQWLGRRKRIIQYLSRHID